MSWRTLSLIAQLTLALYLQAVEWVTLFPWNDLTHGNGQEKLDLAIAAAQTGLVYGTWRRRRSIIALGALLYSLWLVLQLHAWWWPYLRRREPDTLPVLYERYFTRTYKFLPAYGNRIVPDANHVVLHALILVAAITTSKAARPAPSRA